MKIIGITGGVGSGKSCILSYLKEQYSAVIYETDKVARILEEPNHECYRDILAYFGINILNKDGTINRNKLSEIVFNDKEKLDKLNSIVHNKVFEYLNRKIEAERNVHTNYFFIESALLIETEYYKKCDELWYIYSDENTRRNRLKTKRNYSDEKINAIFKNQLNEKEFKIYATRIINNNNSKEDTYYQIDEFMGDLKNEFNL